MPRRKPSLAADLVLLPWWVSLGLAAVAFVVLPAVMPPMLRGLYPIIIVGLVAIAGISALRSWKTSGMLER